LGSWVEGLTAVVRVQLLTNPAGARRRAGLRGGAAAAAKGVFGGGGRMSFSKDDGQSKPLEAETRLVTAGRDTRAQKGFVNPPVVHGSTVLYPTADDLHAHRGEFQYGRRGTPTTKALQ